LIAFSGLSGAGKTTTARAFAKVGALLVSEDLVVLTPNESEPLAVADGELRAHAWARAVAARLSGAPEAAIECGELASVAGSLGSDTLPLRSIWFLDSRRREGIEIQRRPLDQVDGLLALIANNFLGVADGEEWRRHIRRGHQVATRLSLSEVTMPAGPERLEQALRPYVTNSAS